MRIMDLKVVALAALVCGLTSVVTAELLYDAVIEAANTARNVWTIGYHPMTARPSVNGNKLMGSGTMPSSWPP